MRFKFPYSSYKGLKVPLVPIRLQGENGWHWVWAYVDSGATYSIFHSDVAARLELDFRSGKKMPAMVGDGKIIDVFLHELQVGLNENVFKATIGFSADLKIGFNLLGRQDIFQVFRVCFSDRYHEVTFAETI